MLEAPVRTPRPRESGPERPQEPSGGAPCSAVRRVTNSQVVGNGNVVRMARLGPSEAEGGRRDSPECHPGGAGGVHGAPDGFGVEFEGSLHVDRQRLEAHG